MRLKLTFNKATKQWAVDGKDLREFYIEERTKAKRSTPSIEREAGMSHMALYDIEKGVTKTPTAIVGMVLRALEILGYTIEITKQ